MSKGFSLLELVMALGLSLLAVVAVVSLSTNVAMTSMASTRRQGGQVNVNYAIGLVDRELRQATYVPRPVAGGTGATLEGCVNAAVPAGGGAPAAVDESLPMRWFAFCPDGPSLHYHTGSGCPPAYACGAGAAMTFGGGDGAAAATFTRPSTLTTQVDAALSVAVKDQASTARTSVVFSAAAGSNQ